MNNKGKTIVNYKGRKYYQEETDTEYILTSIDKYSGRTVNLFLDKVVSDGIEKERKT
ncbi:hypothetical protein [Fictibacillus terranigra]|uniref:Transposase n=1 Tax=Fictibacillus terranigra TaxID=3058424 RepID=A0ABT8EBR7_9BACL|nr:hypothetical protein [Fictibacillus sp. CENA-BCM004]MDN4075375.1 hypothetical protein [Fictibacillus sp. CENA-BCM004]